jgi:hypothetical protein
VEDLNATLGATNFSTIIETQPLPAYLPAISGEKGGNMLGLERNPRNRLYFSLGAALLTPSAVEQLPQVYQKVSAASQRIMAFAESIGCKDDFVYLAYADALQDPLGSYGPTNVQHLAQAAKDYDPDQFFQKRVNGGFKISRTL